MFADMAIGLATPPQTGAKPRQERKGPEPPRAASDDLAKLLTRYEGNGNELTRELEKAKQCMLGDQHADESMQPGEMTSEYLPMLDRQTIRDLRIRVKQFTQIVKSLGEKLDEPKTLVNADDSADIGQISTNLSNVQITAVGITTEGSAVAETRDVEEEEEPAREPTPIARSPAPETPVVDPEEQGARDELMELDDRIELPPDCEVAVLDARARLLLAAMLSPLALDSLAEVLAGGPVLLQEGDSLGEDDGGDLEGRIVLICRQIQAVEHQLDLTALRLRYFDLQLYLAMESRRKRRSERRRNHTDDLLEVAKLCKWEVSQLQYHLNLGKTIHLISGGHQGLGVFIPTTASSYFGFGPVSTLHQTTDEQAAKIGSIFRGSRRARQMCTLGAAVQSATGLTGQQVNLSPAARGLLRPGQDFTAMTAAEWRDGFEAMYKEQNVRCTCHEE